MAKLSPEGIALLGDFPDRLTLLEPGKSLTITAQRELIFKVRSQIYRYFDLNGLSKQFRLTKESSTTLRILRKELTPIAVTFDEDALTPTMDRFIKTSIMESLSYDEAMARARTSGVFDLNELAILNTHLRRVHSLPSDEEPPVKVRRPETLTDHFGLLND